MDGLKSAEPEYASVLRLRSPKSSAKSFSTTCRPSASCLIGTAPARLRRWPPSQEGLCPVACVCWRGGVAASSRLGVVKAASLPFELKRRGPVKHHHMESPRPLQKAKSPKAWRFRAFPLSIFDRRMHRLPEPVGEGHPGAETGVPGLTLFADLLMNWCSLHWMH